MRITRLAVVLLLVSTFFALEAQTTGGSATSETSAVPAPPPPANPATADQIRELLGATRTEMMKMDDVLGRLARQAGTFSNTIERARRRTRAVGRKLRGVETVGEERSERLLELDSGLDELDDAETEVEPLS